MAAVGAHVFRVALPAGDEGDAVGKEEAHERMADLSGARRILQKAMATEAGIFDEAVALGYRFHTVSHHATRVPHFLGELPLVGEAIRVRREDQRMPAADADVLVHAVAIAEADIRVMAKEARQGVPHVRGSAVLCEVVCSAPAASGAFVPPEHRVVDHVSPQRAAQSDPQRCRAHAPNCEFQRPSGSRVPTALPFSRW